MNNLINISEGTSLAIHSLALIAKKAPERLNIKYLARTLSVSESHLAKIFQRLAKAGVVTSRRGPIGGFVLTEKCNDISILDILEIIEGKVIINNCPLGKSVCLFKKCVFGNKFGKLSKEIYEALKEFKIKEFYSEK